MPIGPRDTPVGTPTHTYLPVASDPDDDVCADRRDDPGALCRAVISGVITSTFLTLLVIPTFYEIFDGFRAWALGLCSKVFKGAEKWAPTTAEHPVP